MHVPDDDLGLYLVGQLPSHRIACVESHLAECSSCVTRLSNLALLDHPLSRLSDLQGGEHGGIEKRRELRIPCDDPGEMQTFSPYSLVKTPVLITDFSRNGLRVRTSQFVGRGTIVQVRVRSAIILGEVRYCIAAGAEFDAGIQIQDMIPKHPG
jgi:hypothetical protein